MSLTKVACIGDSLTFGYLVENRERNCYPAKLNHMLGKSYCVQNFGVNGLTMLKSGEGSYWKHENFKLSLAFNPQIVIIMLGTNDSKPWSWTSISDYINDYEEMIELYQGLPSQPKIYLMTPPTAFVPEGEDKVPFGVCNESIQEMRRAIKKIGEIRGLTVIDINAATANHPEYFPVDGVHVNAEGANLIARTVYQAIHLD